MTVRGTRLVVFGVEYPSMTALAKAYGMDRGMLRSRLRAQGLSPEEAVTRPRAHPVIEVYD